MDLDWRHAGIVCGNGGNFNSTAQRTNSGKGAGGAAMNRTNLKLNREDRANLAHALMHLRENKIACTRTSTGWYVGNKEHFIARHFRAIEFIESLLKREGAK